MRRRGTANTLEGPPRARRFFRRRARAGLISEAVRIDPRTKNLLLRIKPGEIAIILHDDLDQVAAEGLIERGALAVINCHRSITGRYPNAGPLVLARANVPLIDGVGEDILQHVAEGDAVSIIGQDIYRDEQLVGTGTLLDGEALERSLADAEAAMGEELERFVRNTMEYLQVERDLVLRGQGFPELKTKLKDRAAVVVVRGHEYRQDLRTLRPYISDMHPVLIAVDGAADALLDEGLKPDVIIGDMDSVSTNALTCGAEVVVHAYPDGRAPGLERVEALGLSPSILASAGTSEDIALLLAYESGSDLIVAVGAHDNLVEFLDKGRNGMASTFVVRLKVGPKLVDAKGVNRLYRGQVRTRDILLLVTAAVVAMVVAASLSPALRLWGQNVAAWLRSVWRSIF
ncbi:MAG TPA: putative cytokinetic ring protein SteA [Actinomycetota bacterium]|nr:putative cytokinetic ring protein SteA [Actinomycetota bacterium]